VPAPASLVAFARELFDYAGMFPPAELPLEAALRHYARYRRAPESWMLARFILPAGRLIDLAPFVEEILRPLAPLRLSLLTRGGADPEAALAGLREDLDAVAAARIRFGPLLQMESIEARLPAPSMGSPAATAAFARELVRLSAEVGIAQVFLEATGAADWLAANERLIASAAGLPGLGAKFRCGGATAASFPAIGPLAAAIVSARDAVVPWKATAGLHHPYRRPDPATGATMHGFVNLFGAGILAHALGLEEEPVRAILAEEDPGAFRFEEDAFAWRDRRVPAGTAARLRAGHVLSIGSCSFEEPCEDLRALGLLEAR
jgi:hypothetical protein